MSGPIRATIVGAGGLGGLIVPAVENRRVSGPIRATIVGAGGLGGLIVASRRKAAA